MPPILSENTSRVITVIINIVTVVTVGLVAYQSVIVSSINKDMENIKQDSVRDLSFLKERMITEDRILEIIQDKSMYKQDLPRLAQERAEIMTLIAGLQWKIQALSDANQALSTSISDLKADINSTHTQFNSIRIELERIRFQLNLLTDKKKETNGPSTRNGG